MSQNECLLEWIVEEGEVNSALAVAKANGGQVIAKPIQFEPDADELEDMGDAAFEPMLVIAISLSIGALIKVVSDVSLAHKYPGGEVIDIRGGKFKRRPVNSLKKGTLVIISDEETKAFTPDNRDDGLNYLTKALGSLADA